MDEQRQFFRIKNNGEILANYEDQPLDVIEISSKGIAIIKDNVNLAPKGFLDLYIYDDSLVVKYEILRVEENAVILVFKRREDNHSLFNILKKIKNEHRSS